METTTTIATNQAAGRVGDLADAGTVLLTTYRRDGTPVGTPVHIASDDLGVYVRTFDPSGKLRRIRRDPHVTVAACTLRGRVMGPAVPATATVLEGDAGERAADALAHKYPLLHGRLIPWFHRRKHVVTTHLQLHDA